jgi:hypothetical protein
VFLNLVDFTNLVNASGYKSLLGVSHKSLARQMLFIKSNSD